MPREEPDWPLLKRSTTPNPHPKTLPHSPPSCPLPLPPLRPPPPILLVPATTNMPAEHATPAPHDLSLPEPPQAQIKLCNTCRRPLSADAASIPFLLQDTSDPQPVDASIVCASCRSRIPPLPREGLFAEVERELMRRAASLQPAGNEAQSQQQHDSDPSTPTTPAIELCPSQDITMDAHTAIPRPSTTPTVEAPTTSCPPISATFHTNTIVSPRNPQVSSPSPLRPTLSPIDTTGASSSSQAPVAQRAESHNTASRQRSHAQSSSAPDPLSDITRLRVRSQGHHCLYPGATFQGTQKSGRNSYDVNVTIVVRVVSLPRLPEQ